MKGPARAACICILFCVKLCMACTDKAFRCVAQFIYHRVSFQKLVKHVHHATGLANSVQNALQASASHGSQCLECCCHTLQVSLAHTKPARCMPQRSIHAGHLTRSYSLTAAWSSAKPSLHWPWSLYSCILCHTSAVQSCADSKANLHFSWGDLVHKVPQVVRLAVERVEAAGSASHNLF